MIIDEQEEEKDGWENSPSDEPILENRSWKFIATAFFALMTFCTIFASGFYFHESGKNSQEEKKVAAGVADIAMALAYAELKHQAPNKQNWADPDFLNSYITKVVSPDLDPQAVINPQGQFNNYPYLLRVYTTSDMSQYLVIAQPGPHFFQWLIQKKAIVIDSKAMELRKISDLKTLNRLLANQNPLSGSNGEEISRLIKQGTIMPISSLTGKRNRWGFAPPKRLSALKPGAENYVYNAPRFFPLTESLLKSSIAMQNSVWSKEQSHNFEQELDALMQFPNIVFYSSEGEETALKALKSLSTLIPEEKLTVAFIRFNDDGIVLTSRIVDRQDDESVAELEAKALDIKLQNITNNRQKKLEEISLKISALIEQNNTSIVPNFHEKMQQLIAEYENVDFKEQDRLMEELENMAEKQD